MKAIAVNGSPRKTWNTATLLKKALEGAATAGAATKLIHLYDLTFKGCSSCFSCKRVAAPSVGACAMRDDLTPVLAEIMASDVLLIGSPVYLGDITGETRSFFERLVFMNLIYDMEMRSAFEGRINVGLVYTMNVTEARSQINNYSYLYESHKQYAAILNGTVDAVMAYDTYQFRDYSLYHAPRFDEPHKARVKAERFPQDCRNAYDLGRRLTSYIINR